jgi:hypothetical protein
MSVIRDFVDARAPKTVCGKDTAHTLCTHIGISFQLLPSANKLKFAHQTSRLIGCFLVPVQTQLALDHCKWKSSKQISRCCLDWISWIICRLRLTANSLTNQLESVDGWKLPLSRMADTFTWNGATCMLRCFQLHSCISQTNNFSPECR